MGEAMDSLHGRTATRRLFEVASLVHHLERPPSAMVDEEDVIALYRAARQLHGAAEFARISRLADRLTGDYVMPNRIPAAARALLKLLPGSLAAQLLAKAIAAHAWTFVGSGTFTFERTRKGLTLLIGNSPIARGEHSAQPLCDFYTATFEHIFRTLAQPRCRVTETHCVATGASHCRFDVRLK
jgi:divinyl protochlorophyllide a 8-vinyl-reductase